MFFGLNAEELSAYATIATAVIATLALILAYIQLRVNKEETRLGVAKGIYKDYLALAFANPKFSSASYPIDAPRLHTFSNNVDEYEKYEFIFSSPPRKYWISQKIARNGAQHFEISFVTMLFTFKAWISPNIIMLLIY